MAPGSGARCVRVDSWSGCTDSPGATNVIQVVATIEEGSPRGGHLCQRTLCRRMLKRVKCGQQFRPLSPYAGALAGPGRDRRAASADASSLPDSWAPSGCLRHGGQEAAAANVDVPPSLVLRRRPGRQAAPISHLCTSGDWPAGTARVQPWLHTCQQSTEANRDCSGQRWAFIAFFQVERGERSPAQWPSGMVPRLHFLLRVRPCQPCQCNH